MADSTASGALTVDSGTILAPPAAPEADNTLQTSGAAKPRHKGGRPTKYRPDMPARASQYFQEEAAKGEFPGQDDLAVLFDVDIDQIKEWKKKHPEFHASLSKCKAIGKKCLIRGALSEKFNASFSKFLAINNFDMISENAVSKNEHTFPKGIEIVVVKAEQKSEEKT